jgi:signal transduction histidine kinase/ActR/RegA family two-component response regulator
MADGITSGPAGGWDGWVSHQLAIQRVRLLAYVVSWAALSALSALRAIGNVTMGWAAFVGFAALSFATVVGFSAAVRAAGRDPERLGRFIRPFFDAVTPIWSLCDVFFTAAGCYATGGDASPWFMTFGTAVIGAGFHGGLRSALWLAALSAAAYLAVLGLMGHLEHETAMVMAVARIVLLSLVVMFGLRGALALKRKKVQLEQLRAVGAARVDELTRLTQSLDERTRELAEANLRIREADQQKSQFLANMSHELRTPLNSIIGFSEVLEKRLAGQIGERQLKFLSNIHASGTHLLGLINDILDLSKIEAGKLELHPERLAASETIEAVVAIVRGTAQRRDIRLVVDVAPDLPPIEADAARFKQVLFNLLSNAVKFSRDGAEVTIRARSLAADASPLAQDALVVSVQDRGIGIDESHHALVFQEFRQVDAGLARRAEGTGLGLALVKRFVELHRGVVRLESRLGEGATFTVILPVVFAGQRGCAAEPEVAPLDATLPRVLVVEDDAAAWGELAAELSRGRFQPLRAKTGEETLELARALRPVAITLDLVLPGVDGWEVLKRLRADASTCDIPVVIVSMLDNKDLGQARGADGFFVKPTDGEALRRRIHELAPQAAVSGQLDTLLEEVIRRRAKGTPGGGYRDV